MMKRSLAAASVLWMLSSQVVAIDRDSNGVTELLETYCVDCHGSPDEFPESGFSLTADFSSQPLDEVGPALKKALDAVEGYEMPPSDAEQPNAGERAGLIRSIRDLLARPEFGDRRNPGTPVLRRMTRLEYNNTVRDLLGLETDVFMFSERLPFERSHYQPQTKRMPDRLTMSAREYGAKYSVLLPDASMPGDHRAEYGFTNRGDAQSLSAVRLQQYIKVAGAIAYHPELLSRARRMEELLPNARFQQATTPASRKAKLLASSVAGLAENDNVDRTSSGSAVNLDAFRRRLAVAFSEDRGGVFSGETLQNTTVAGKGGLLRVVYGKNAIRTFAINPNEDLWFAAFATADESSGDVLFANHRKQQKQFELTFQSGGQGPFAGIAELGFVLLSRRGQDGLVHVTATLDNDTKQEQTIDLKAGAGFHNTFVSFATPEHRSIKRLAIDGREFSGDYVLMDDLAFITRDPPNHQALVQAEEPAEEMSVKGATESLGLNRELAKQSATKRLRYLMTRAFRRSISEEELAVYLRLYREVIQEGGDDETAMRTAIHSILASPSFLYVARHEQNAASVDSHARVGRRANEDGESDDRESDDRESDDRESGEKPSLEQRVVPLSGYQLASRLSYFLWSSMPDDELLRLAARGDLHDASVLEAQVRRMLADPRSIELSESFFVQWLKLAELWTAQPDRRQFREYYSGPLGKRTLAQDMFGEVLLQFQTMLVEDQDVFQLLDAPYVYVNGKMIQYYGQEVDELVQFSDGSRLFLDDLKQDRIWYRVKPFDVQRGGVVTSPAVLTLTSFPHRTSSIRRGVWILDTVFNRHPPAPKVAVADIEDQDDLDALTLRAKVLRHREDAACAVCHDRIDPPGFALENFDAIGRWRSKDGEHPIDPSGELPGLGQFQDPSEFQDLLMADKRRFLRGFTEHMLSYALARKLEYFDVPTVESIVERLMAEDRRISRLIVEIVKSDAFRFTVLEPPFSGR